MKKYYLLFLAPLFALALHAQKLKISVDEKSENINGGSHPCLVVTIYDAKPEDIEREWKSKMRGYDAKVSSKGEIFADNAMIKEISANACDVYARTEKGGDDNETKFIVGFLLGETWLNSSNSDSYKAAEKIVKEFAQQMTNDGIGDKVKIEQKKMDKLTGDQSDLVKKNKDLKDDIADYEAKIKKANDDIKANEDAQAKKKDELDAQQKVLDAIKARQNSVE